MKAQLPREPSSITKRELREQLQVRLAKDHAIRTGHLSLNECIRLALEHGITGDCQDAP